MFLLGIIFIRVAVKVLPRLARTWLDISDIMCFPMEGISGTFFGKLIKKQDGPNEVDSIIKTLLKYGKEEVVE
jgi:hypothetical protein